MLQLSLLKFNIFVNELKSKKMGGNFFQLSLVISWTGSLTLVVVECHRPNTIKARDPIRCQECGYRIMYKKRTERCEFSLCINSYSDINLAYGHFMIIQL